MTIQNIILIILVLGISVAVIYYYINSKKNAEVISEIDIDDQT